MMRNVSGSGSMTASRGFAKAGLAGLAAVALALALAACLASCAGKAEQAAVQTAPAAGSGSQSGPRFSLRLEPGPQYTKDMHILFYSYTVRPQVAVWLESPDGRYLDTMYVTEVVVTGKFAAAPKKGRPEALPVWSHIDKSGTDAVSSPTAKGSSVVYGNDLAARLPAGTYVVKLETNRSYDWNATYTKRNAGVNGQPSLVYRAEIAIGGERAEALFQPIGTGSVDGSDGAVRPGLTGMDTALELFSSMKIVYETD